MSIIKNFVCDELIIMNVKFIYLAVIRSFLRYCWSCGVVRKKVTMLILLFMRFNFWGFGSSTGLILTSYVIPKRFIIVRWQRWCSWKRYWAHFCHQRYWSFWLSLILLTVVVLFFSIEIIIIIQLETARYGAFLSWL